MDETKIIYSSMLNSKKNNMDFSSWLHDFLLFTKKKDYDPRSDLINPDTVEHWKTCMSSDEGFEKNKKISDEMIKYAAKSYIFFSHPSNKPSDLNNMSQIVIEKERIVDFFQMNFFNIKLDNVIFHGFVEGLSYAVDRMQRKDIFAVEYLISFFHIFFSNFDFIEEKTYGPAKTRFFEIHRKVSHIGIKTNPNGSLTMSDVFYNSIPPEVASKIKSKISDGTKPSPEDYVWFIQELKSVEDALPKKTIQIAGYPNYVITKSKQGKRDKWYLAHAFSGKVLRVYNDGDMGSVFRDVKKFLSN